MSARNTEEHCPCGHRLRTVAELDTGLCIACQQRGEMGKEAQPTKSAGGTPVESGSRPRGRPRKESTVMQWADAEGERAAWAAVKAERRGEPSELPVGESFERERELKREEVLLRESQRRRA